MPGVKKAVLIQFGGIEKPRGRRGVPLLSHLREGICSSMGESKTLSKATNNASLSMGFEKVRKRETP